MSATRLSRMQKAAAIVPLALLSAAWTASLAGFAPTTSVSAAVQPEGDGGLPGGATVPDQAIQAPASVSSAGQASPSFDRSQGDIDQIVATSSTNGIPSSALAAYQRAETVINAADRSCRLGWQLVAAIGRVESDHGRVAGSALDSDGVAIPSIFGPALDGKGATSLIRDTDNGMLDEDRSFDRAMGPMQFIPSTWSVVQVDADNDGVRNPQDIDDAALASAVYLCSGPGDLSTESGRSAAVYRYNHSQSYVDLVLSIAENYVEGDFTSVPDSTTSAGYLTPLPPIRVTGNGGGKPGKAPVKSGTAAPGPTAVQPDPAPSSTPTPAPGGGGSTGGGAGGGTGGGTGGGSTPKPPPVKVPPLPVPVPDVPDVPDTGIPPVDAVLTAAEAKLQCIADGINVLDVAKLAKCIADYTTP